jgi:hypothetical protein
MTSATPYFNEWGMPEPPIAGNEADSLIGSLERQRNTFAWKCRGVDAAGMAVTVGASTLTLGGLLKHLAFVEAEKFAIMMLGENPGVPWNQVDWEANPEWPWTSAADDSPEELMALWQRSVVRSREVTAQLMAGDGLDTPADYTTPDGQSPSLRRLLVDLIEEYARHTGHADLIRESIDGLVGEDPPPETPLP